MAGTYTYWIPQTTRHTTLRPFLLINSRIISRAHSTHLLKSFLKAVNSYPTVMMPLHHTLSSISLLFSDKPALLQQTRPPPEQCHHIKGHTYGNCSSLGAFECTDELCMIWVAMPQSEQLFPLSTIEDVVAIPPIHDLLHLLLHGFHHSGMTKPQIDALMGTSQIKNTQPIGDLNPTAFRLFHRQWLVIVLTTPALHKMPLLYLGK